MKIDLKKLKLHLHATEVFHLQALGRDAYLRDIGGRYIEPVNVELVVENNGNLFIGKGKLYTVIELSCSRCLEKFSYTIAANFGLTMAEKTYQDYPEEDEDIIFFERDEADITSYIEQVIFTEIPFKPLCDNECQGLCPLCGINRNIDKCECQQEFLDPRWEKLKKLK